MNVMANQDILAGQWKQAQGMLKHWWGKLTDDDLKQITGHVDILIGKVQERYGYTREQAEKEVVRFIEQLDKPKS